MAHSSAQYKELLKSLMPRGKAWNRDEDSVFDQVLYGAADELSRSDVRAEELVDEMFVDTVSELITEWEEEFGIETDTSKSLATRIEELKAAFVARGQQDKGYFESVADKIDYTIHIEEYAPGISGLITSGDACGCNDNFFIWHIRSEIYPDKGEYDYSFGMSFDNTPTYDVGFVQDMIRNLDLLIETIDKIKPGHTMALYDFYGIEFGRGFGWGFSGAPHHDGSIPIEEFDGSFSEAFTAQGHYDGNYLIGAFSGAFDLSYDAHRGGDFERDSFSDAFIKPI